MKKSPKSPKANKKSAASLDLFQHFTYKTFLAANLQAWGEVSRLAKAAGCQRSYISQVIHGSQQLTMDQAFGLCTYWKMNPAQKHYFLLLVQIERAATKEYREDLVRELEKVRASNHNIAERLQRKNNLTNDNEVLYFSAWYWVAIHHLTSLPDCRTTSQIATRLNLPVSTVQECLEKLETMNLVRQSGIEWTHTFENVHVPKASPLVYFHHMNWRQRALVSAQSPITSGLHFTDARTMSRQDFEVIKNILLEQIDRVAKIAEPSAPEELVSFNLDFYKI